MMQGVPNTLVRIERIAGETFGDSVKAGLWLERPLSELGGKSPLVFSQTEAGAHVVAAILGKIDFGAAF